MYIVLSAATGKPPKTLVTKGGKPSVKGKRGAIDRRWMEPRGGGA